MKALKTKDYVFLAIISAIYITIYMVVAGASSLLGAYGHNVSPGLFALPGGTVIYFIARKLGKMFQFTILTTIIMGIFTVMGGGYLPWWITSILTALIADWLVSRSTDFPTWKLAVAFSIMQVGQLGGSLVPVLFFVENYRQHWIDRGQTPEYMEASIAATQGLYGISMVLLTIVLCFIGTYLGAFILKKHFVAKSH